MKRFRFGGNGARKPMLTEKEVKKGYPQGLKSDFEWGCYSVLDDIAPRQTTYEQERYAYIQHHVYTPDYLFKGIIPIEAKGGSGPKGLVSGRRTAMLLAREQNPELENLVIVLYEPYSECTGTMTHSAWCIKSSFVWCEQWNLANTVEFLISGNVEKNYQILLERQRAEQPDVKMPKKKKGTMKNSPRC